MSAACINMEYGRHVIFVQAQVVIHSVGGRNCLVVITVGDKGAGSFFSHLFFVGECCFQFAGSVFTQKIVVRSHVSIGFIHGDDRIEQDLKIGTKLGAGMCGDGGSQMASGGGSHYPYVVWIQVPYTGAVAYHFHGSLGVRDGECAVSVRHPVFQYNQRYALFVEVRCPVITFVVDSQSAISAPRTGYYGASCRQFGSRKKDAERRVVDIKRLGSLLGGQRKTC